MSAEKVAFFGKHNLSTSETDKLVLLGQLFGYKNIALHTIPGVHSTDAVSAGYRSTGHQPIMHTDTLDRAADEIVVYCDDDLYKRLIPKIINTPSKRWTCIRSEEQLDKVLDLVTAMAKEDGILPALS